jgi:hypothetical protein
MARRVMRLAVLYAFVLILAPADADGAVFSAGASRRAPASVAAREIDLDVRVGAEFPRRSGIPISRLPAAK